MSHVVEVFVVGVQSGICIPIGAYSLHLKIARKGRLTEVGEVIQSIDIGKQNRRIFL